MIERFEQAEQVFGEIDAATKEKIPIYTIGGAVLLKRGLKPATKDIDLVVSSRQEFLNLQNALVKIGFSKKIPGKEYTHMNLNQIFQRGEFSIDVFEKEVCGKFSLSENMMKRAEKVIELKHITVYLCSNEDIFLFKNMTERDGDITDCYEIATKGPDWNIILEELQHQIRQSKQDIWVTWVGERMDILEERGINIPIMDQLNQLREAYMEKWMKERER
ncbi:MAG: DUF6036 family nucleotidyltransferase [archaeon]